MKTKDWLVFLGLSLAWGSSFLWIKIAVQEIGPFTLVALRLLFGILGLLIVVAIRKPEWPKDPKIWRVLAVLGMINTAIPFTLISWGEVYIDSSVASILNSSVPLFTVLIAHFFLDDDKLTWTKGLGLPIGFIGVVLLVGRDLGKGSQSNVLGQGAVLLAAILYAAAAVYSRKNTKGVPFIMQAMIPLFFADAALWISVPLVESPFTLPSLPITWVAVAWLGLIGSCVAYLLYFYLVHNVGPTSATQVTYTFPVIGVILGVVFLNEKIDLYLALGAALVIVSLLVVNRKPKQKVEA